MKLTTFEKIEESIVEEQGAGVKDEESIKDYCMNEEEKKSATEEDGVIAEKSNTTIIIKEKPVPLPRVTKWQKCIDFETEYTNFKHHILVLSKHRGYYAYF